MNATTPRYACQVGQMSVFRQRTGYRNRARLLRGQILRIEYQQVPAVSRFLQVDPFNPVLRLTKKARFDAFLAQPRNWNGYAYVWNNPLRHIDPTGESVYLVLYTQGNSKGDDELRRAAQTRRSNQELEEL